LEQSFRFAQGESTALARRARLSATHQGVKSGRWSRRATLLFVVAVCGGFWLLVALSLDVVLR